MDWLVIKYEHEPCFIDLKQIGLEHEGSLVVLLICEVASIKKLGLLRASFYSAHSIFTPTLNRFSCQRAEFHFQSIGVEWLGGRSCSATGGEARRLRWIYFTPPAA